MYKVLSYQIADSIDIKSAKANFKSELYFSDSDELFYKTGENQYVYIFKYGVVCFLNFDENNITNTLKTLSEYCSNFFEEQIHEVFVIDTDCKEINFGYSKIEIPNPDIESIRLIMLNVAQSVALDYYAEQTKVMLQDTNKHTFRLGNTGKLGIRGNQLKRYIGRTLNLKNRIAKNLYIFDSPDVTWENENLNKLDNGLKKTFDLHSRHKDIQEDLEIIKENLELFRDIMNHRKDTVLEWIVILLILIEVLDILVREILK